MNEDKNPMEGVGESPWWKGGRAPGGRGREPQEGGERGWHQSPRQKASRGRRVGVGELTMISLVLIF